MSTALAHEIKNPAALAMAYAALIRQESDNQQVSRYCTRIQELLLDISALVQELLQATPSHQAPACNVDISHLIYSIIDKYRAAMPGLLIVPQVLPGIVMHTQEGYVRIVLSNLIKNAVQAAGDTGHICVQAACANSTVEIRITNSCQQLQKPKLDSSGLGLPICEWLLSQIGGKMQTNAEEINSFSVVVTF